MEQYGTGYLEERKLVKRWNGPISAIVSLLFTLGVFYVSWWIFQDPRGWLRMYTPYVGYMYTRWWLIVLIWMVYLFNYWQLLELVYYLVIVILYDLLYLIIHLFY